MSEAVRSKTKIITIIAVSFVVIIGAVVGGIWAGIANSPSHKVQTITNAQHQLAQISYQGQNGLSALALLKKHASVQVKHYSFGDFVTSIDGVVGNGPKYWTFYINSKEASVSASSYITKNSDKIEWKLQ